MRGQPTASASLTAGLKTLRLPTFTALHEEVALKAEKEGWSFGTYLSQLVERELVERDRRRLARQLKASKLPTTKTLATLDTDRLSPKVKRLLPRLCEGDFIARAENVLAFGLPGRGKTHLLCAIGHELIRRGHTVLFISTCHLVQRLLAARQELKLERVLARLESFDAVIVDDIGYVQQSREEMEVLFTFLAERYERKSVLLSSNLVFSQWDRIFKDPMTTAAAIDRLVHHSTILELTGPSYRTQTAEQRQAVGDPSPAPESSPGEG